LDIRPLEIEGLLLIAMRRHGDARGFFSEVFRKDIFEAAAGPVEFVQDNHSRSAARGTLRGLHYQAPPAAQGKLVRVTRGAVLDVAVDIRRSSPTFGRHIAVELSEENWQALWVPPGFLHGFCTLTDDVIVAYKVDAYYTPRWPAAVLDALTRCGTFQPVFSASSSVSMLNFTFDYVIAPVKIVVWHNRSQGTQNAQY
jgi:dTDP-4-dehydrorhamnose 3,5-epimerase